MRYYITGFNKNDANLALKIEIPSSYLGDMKIIMDWNNKGFESFINKASAFEVKVERSEQIKNLILEIFSNSQLDYQVSSNVF